MINLEKLDKVIRLFNNFKVEWTTTVTTKVERGGWEDREIVKSIRESLRKAVEEVAEFPPDDIVNDPDKDPFVETEEKKEEKAKTELADAFVDLAKGKDANAKVEALIADLAKKKTIHPEGLVAEVNERGERKPDEEY